MNAGIEYGILLCTEGDIQNVEIPVSVHVCLSVCLFNCLFKFCRIVSHNMLSIYKFNRNHGILAHQPFFTAAWGIWTHLAVLFKLFNKVPQGILALIVARTIKELKAKWMPLLFLSTSLLVSNINHSHNSDLSSFNSKSTCMFAPSEIFNLCSSIQLYPEKHLIHMNLMISLKFTIAPLIR